MHGTEQLCRGCDKKCALMKFVKNLQSSNLNVIESLAEDAGLDTHKFSEEGVIVIYCNEDITPRGRVTIS